MEEYRNIAFSSPKSFHNDPQFIKTAFKTRHKKVSVQRLNNEKASVSISTIQNEIEYNSSIYIQALKFQIFFV